MKKWIKFYIVFYLYLLTACPVGFYYAFDAYIDMHCVMHPTDLGDGYTYYRKSSLLTFPDDNKGITLVSDIDSLNQTIIVDLDYISEVKYNKRYILAERKLDPNSTSKLWLIDKKKSTVYGPYSNESRNNFDELFEGTDVNIR